MAVPFPSVEWFEVVRNISNSSESFRKFGTVDATVGIKIPDLQKHYILTFEALECTSAREVSEEEVEQADFWMEQDYAGWKDMLANIKAKGRADLKYTLNTIDLEMPNGLARSHDGYKLDLFFRYNQSLQEYFDASAAIDTEFVQRVSA